MRLYDFNLLPEKDKYKVLSIHGVIIGDLMEGEYKIVLYQIHSFYIELYYYRVDRKPKRLTAFSSTENLGGYLNQINLQDLVAPSNSVE